MRLAGVVAGAMLCLVACTDAPEPVTKSELREWLETGNSDVMEADPGCVIDPLWDAGLSDAELREFVDAEGTELPSRVDVYTSIRDECTRTGP